jgi:hypothetical protein
MVRRFPIFSHTPQAKGRVEKPEGVQQFIYGESIEPFLRFSS